MQLKSLEKAIEEQFLINIDLDRNIRLDLIVDGATENNNINIHEFIKNCKVGIEKKIALKDVTFSNSMIEGNNRILKQTYLKNKAILSENFAEYISGCIEEYNSEKPHYVHKIYTPNEIHGNPDLKNTKPVFERLNQQRIENNKRYVCGNTCI